MAAEGVTFKPSVNVGVDYPAERLRKEFDAVVLAGGATQARDLPVPGRELKGVHFAMEFLTQQNKVCEGDSVPRPDHAPHGKHVVILGGGDTGSDCLGTSNRHGALSVHQFELMPQPPDDRTPDMPWPYWPMILRTSSSHEEGVVRDFSINTAASAATARATSRSCTACAWSGSWTATAGRRWSASRAASSSSTPTWCCSRWASPAPRRARC